MAFLIYGLTASFLAGTQGTAGASDSILGVMSAAGRTQPLPLALMARIANDQAFSDEVQDEDIRICESVQQGLASGLYDAGRLCPKRESGVWHFHNLLRAAYGDA